MIVRLAIAGSAAALLLASCGGTEKTVTQTIAAPHGTRPAAPKMMTRAQAAQAYLAAVAPANAAGDALSAKAQSYTDSTTGTQVAADAQPYARALTALNANLLSIANRYPPAAGDLKALVQAYNPLIGDLQGASTTTAFSASAWVQQLLSDLSKTRAAVAIVRSDLGLPPARS